MKSKVTVESLTLYVNRGITPKYTEVIDDSITVLNQKCIRDFKVSLEPSRRNDLSKRKITEGKMLKKHDVLINSTGVGTLGRVAQYFGADDDATVDSHVTIVRPNPELVDPIYFGYLMKSKQSLIESFAEGTTGQTELNRNSVKELLLGIINDIPRQKIIGDILLEFDQKLDLNAQTNQTLEQIAQALFKSWFVDFDPVKAKMETLAAGGNADDAELAAMSVISAKNLDELNNLKASNPEAFNKLAQTAALFPAVMQDSELGEIPEGWEVSEIGSEVTVVGGGTPSTKNTDFWEGGTIHWTTPKDMSGLSSKVLTSTDRKITDLGLKKISSGLLPENTVLMSSRAPVGYLALAKIPVAINQGYIAMKCEARLSPEYVLLWCDHNMEEIKQRASGTTFSEISKANFKPIPAIVPVKSIIDTFTVQVSEIYNFVHSNVLQSESLSLTRDLLLPKLLSGEIFKGGK